MKIKDLQAQNTKIIDQVNNLNSQKLKSVINNQKSDYLSFLCRNGPLPQKYQKYTDFYCVIIYGIFFVTLFILIIINGLGSTQFTDKIYQQNYGNILYGYRYHITQISSASFVILIIGMFISFIALWIPSVMAFLSIFIMLSLASFFMINQFKKFIQNDHKNLRNIFTSIFLLIFQIVILVLLVRRYKRLKNLGTFLKLSSKAIKPYLFLIYSHMILLSLFQIFISWLFANIYYGVSTIKQIQEKQTINFFTKFILVIFWFWTSGILIAVSDYFICSFTIQWFYYLSKYDQEVEKYENAIQFENNQQQNQSHRVNRSSFQILIAIYKTMFKHFGTLIFGSILTYLPLYLIAKIQKFLSKFSSKQFSISSYSKYCYIDTILQYQNFKQSNYKIYQLRHRIKSVMPQLYLLGHIYGDFTKLSLIMVGISFIHQFIDSINMKIQSNIHFIQYLFILLIFGITLGLQISTNFANIIGKCGDVAFILYCVDLQIERVFYSNNGNFSTPQSLMVILRNLTIKRQWKE